MDQSRQVQLTRQTYGGSSSTEPSFNWSEYARHVSITDPKDLGVLDGRRLIQEGFIGAESGGQTLFFQFRLERRTRIRLRLTSTNVYTIQYITASVRGPGGDAIDLPVDQAEIPQEIDVATFYVEPGYWDEGYTRVEINPSLSAEIPQEIDVVTLYVEPFYWDEGYTEGQQYSANPSTSVPASSFSSVDPGTYIVVVSSSQWPRLPYRLEIVGSGGEPLSAICDVAVDLVGGMGFANLSAIADIGIEAKGAAASQGNLTAAVGFSFTTVGGITRIAIGA